MRRNEVKKKAAIVAVFVLGLIVGYAGPKIPRWYGNVVHWWNSIPSGSSELAIYINDALDDEGTWQVIVESSTLAITNGKIVLYGVNSDNNYSSYNSVIKVNGKNISESLSSAERTYLLNKGRKIFKALRYNEAVNSLKD
jgi:hypothetical protein